MNWIIYSVVKGIVHSTRMLVTNILPTRSALFSLEESQVWINYFWWNYFSCFWVNNVGKPFSKYNICWWQVVLLFSATSKWMLITKMFTTSSTYDTASLCICYTLCHNKSNYLILKWHSDSSQKVKLFSLHLHPLYSICTRTHRCTSKKLDHTYQFIETLSDKCCTDVPLWPSVIALKVSVIHAYDGEKTFPFLSNTLKL